MSQPVGTILANKGNQKALNAEAAETQRRSELRVEVFGDVLRAVMRPQVKAEVTINEKGLTLRVQRNGELQGLRCNRILDHLVV
jgi:hypothetical protein